ncbi:hypothetical protein VTK26DRAFT_3822 [Humicola hyalothermophila]
MTTNQKHHRQSTHPIPPNCDPSIEESNKKKGQTKSVRKEIVLPSRFWNNPACKRPPRRVTGTKYRANHPRARALLVLCMRRDLCLHRLFLSLRAILSGNVEMQIRQQGIE